MAAEKPIIPILTGPTGSGKTGVSVRLLEKFPSIEIISADSRQIYQYLSIGTDKPAKEILDRYTIHLVDCVTPGQRFTAFDFTARAEGIIVDIIAQKKIPPLVCGGTGLYIRALVEGLVEIPEEDFEYRRRLKQDAVEKGPKYLFEQLEKIDPLEAGKTHPHNIKRIIRALEIYHLTGKSKSELIAVRHRKKDACDYKIFCLLPPRDELYKAINDRVDEMIEAGLLNEVEKIYELGLKKNVEKINVIGYNEMFEFFDGKLSREEAINLIKQNSRRFAKRQITWFRGMENIEYISDRDEAFLKLCEFYVKRIN